MIQTNGHGILHRVSSTPVSMSKNSVLYNLYIKTYFDQQKNYSKIIQMMI